MRKEIIEFERNTDADGNFIEYSISLLAYQLSSDEQKLIRSELEEYNVVYAKGYNVVFEYIDSDSLRVIIHHADYNLLKELEKNGWSF